MLFSDIVSYTTLASQLEPIKVRERVSAGMRDCAARESVDARSRRSYIRELLLARTEGLTPTAKQVVRLLNEMYSAFDVLVDEFDCYKVETIGERGNTAADSLTRRSVVTPWVGRPAPCELATRAYWLRFTCGSPATSIARRVVSGTPSPTHTQAMPLWRCVALRARTQSQQPCG